MSLQEWLNKIYRTPLSCLVITICCLSSIWCAIQVFPITQVHGYRSISVIRRFFDLKQSIGFAKRSSIFDNENGQYFTPDNFFDLTFGPDSSKRPADWQLQPNLQGYLANESDEITSFLSTRLLDNPVQSNYLSQKLRTSLEVIREAQRIHYNMFSDVIGQFKYCMLLDTSNTENKGDPAITIGEIYFIARMGIEIIYYCNEVTWKTEALDTAASIARTYSPTELVIFLHGGGNVNAYYRHDDIRGKVFTKFQGYQFFIFPQSILVRNEITTHFQECIRNYCCNENLTFVFRDHQSYSEAKKYFNGTSRLLVAPDMAFHIGPVKRFLSPVFDILWIKRNDTERAGYNKIPEHPPHLRLHVSDWLTFPTPQAGTNLEKSFYATVMGLFFTQRGRVVITDRFHGHVFATLLNIPHVLLDNPAKKLSSYHNTWTKGLENTRLTDNPKTALTLALELLDIYGERQIPPRVPFLNVSEYFHNINYSLPETSYP